MKRVLLLASVVLFAGCGGRGFGPTAVELSPPETFNWTTGQPISFSPPPDTWNRSRYQNGGAEGADFVLAGSKGEQIYVAERFFLGRRDRCGRMKEILEGLDGYSRSGFIRTIGRARLDQYDTYNPNEKRMAETVNYTLERATEAFLNGDTVIARVELERALEQAGTILYTVEETVDEVLFTKKRNPVYPSLQVDEPVAGELNGDPALVVKFTFNGHGTPMVGRRVYVAKNNRMFEFGFQGHPTNLRVFEAILDTVTFPPGTCEH